MTTKSEYRKLFKALKKPSNDTQKVFEYFGNDDKFFFINGFDGKSFLGQAGHIMAEIAIEENGDLTAILGQTRETLTLFIPPDIADFDRVDWGYIALNYLCGEFFDELEDWS